MKKKSGFKYFTSADLGVIKRNTNQNRHSENYLFIAEKIKYPTVWIKEYIRQSDKRGYSINPNALYEYYQNVMRDLGNKTTQIEYQAVYSRL